jgi:antitoxin CptB
MNEASDPSRLRWRCRRGMQELDLLLGRWLESRWPNAGAEMQSAFEQLLECEDDLIWDWLMGRDRPHPSLYRVVEDIREIGFGQPGP